MNFRSAVKKAIPKNLFRAIEPYGHLAEAVLTNTLQGFPARGLKVIGVTGTDGKTTTCTMIAEMLRANGLKVATITTTGVDYGDGKGVHPNPASLTTQSKPLLQLFKKVHKYQVDWVVLETSSHALAQHRVWGVPYSVAVFTNLTHEHLDYHGTFERYRDAKRKLFKQCNRNRRGLRAGVINADDPSAEFFARDIAHPLTYGLEHGDLRASSIKLTPEGSTFTAMTASETYRLTCQLPGAFNVYNALAAVNVGRAVGLTPEQIEKGIAALERVPGRMERVVAGQPFEVLVDYAVTPESLKNVLQAAHGLVKGKVHIVFGATGDRDKSKRPLMGQAVAQHADFIYLTDDETYTEDPEKIRAGVLEGIIAAGGKAKTTVINDRRAAIAAAFKAAKKGDVVLLTGFGHQTQRNMGGKKLPWHEATIARELLQKNA